ncbi:MAG TPA: hypothetical protein VGR43_11715 [Dehalococcoidia bacterium]|nr:hypothetical protein [Dehalococcoidia bacterium]
MKKKIAAAAVAAVAVLNVISVIDKTNIVSQVAEKAAELIQKAVAFAFGAA